MAADLLSGQVLMDAVLPGDVLTYCCCTAGALLMFEKTWVCRVWETRSTDGTRTKNRAREVGNEPKWFGAVVNQHTRLAIKCIVADAAKFHVL